MGRYRQDIIAKKSSVLKHLNVSSSGIVTVGAGNVYYENSASEYAQVVITDEFGNIQPLIFSTNKDVTEYTIEQTTNLIAYSETLE
tara:strand:- start:215 stop:472 length:258 start_codon:yes stop_codon:yes gene_type:complete